MMRGDGATFLSTLIRSLAAFAAGGFRARDGGGAQPEPHLASGSHKHAAESPPAKTRADEATQEKSRFFAEVIHELRTPLNAILGFSEVIGRELFGPAGDARYAQYGGLIHDAAT